MKTYHARLAMPFGVLGVVTEGEALSQIDFLPGETPLLHAQTPLAREVCAQLQAYAADPAFRFDLPLLPRGTSYQHRVWQALLEIPSGQTESYGALASQLGSAPRAVGQACGTNPIPVIIPCHRVLAKTGLGGFMNHAEGSPLQIKRWLLEHEHVQLRTAG
ncbi:MAG: methylated-DNA--[protein]-cysteine S-methyltransferase [Sulfurimicrobium sp.]|nr:methylated-DNA--[protein]-cysteine S-methyltransferase [Sulfurimicrobium sp.]MDP1705303.1 methylated-DNA--[protein]-cysteine S-methyltransferase [Sulfurimicrobium sp.]MDP2198089.1 methylated-DNA--[protein]-cysteine S-methyltransferase [Sulfurimicrobium sp.]MDP3687466.1 methylated-DNA--[protein]-cysteine S-methyltransferase [Sulfurimicrobium sp.]